MNLTISTAATGMMNVSAAEEYSSEAAVETYAEESAQTYAEDTVAPEQVISETDAAYYSSDIGSEVTDTAVVSAETDTTASTVSADIETTAATVSGGENQTEMPTETPIETPTEIPAISSTEIETTAETTDSIPSIEESSQIADTDNTTEVSETETEEETSEEESEEESETSEEEKIASFAGDTTITGTIDPKKLKGYSNTNGVESITIEKAEELILLSNCDPKDIQNITINLNNTGEFDLTKTIEVDTDLSDFFSDSAAVNVDSDEEMQVINEGENNASDESNVAAESNTTSGEPESTISAEGNTTNNVASEQDDEQDSRVAEYKISAGQKYEFQGIGSETCPFKGKIIGTNLQLKVNRAFFGGLSSDVSIALTGGGKLTLTWSGDGTKTMIADMYQFDSVTDAKNILLVKVIRETANDSKAVMGSLFGIVQASNGNENAVLTIGDDNVTYNGNVTVSSADGNAGLICNTLKSGTIRLEGYQLPNISTTIDGKNNAGGLIGEMEQNTTLQIASALTNVTTSGTKETTTPITITAKQNAGGVVGKMADSAKIFTETNGNITLKGISVTGSVSAGGVVGDAENVTFSDLLGEIKIDSPVLKGDSKGANVGGFIGTYTLGKAEDTEAKPYSLSGKINIVSPSVLVIGTQNRDGGNAGGYFGLLNLKGIVSYTIGLEQVNPLNEFNTTYRNNELTGGNAWSYGGLIGQITATNIQSTLKIQNIKINSTFPIYKTSPNRPKYHGGLIGYIGSGTIGSYVEINNVQIKVKNPHAIFGGAAGCLETMSILRVKDITVVTESDRQDAKIWDGGGVLGEAKAGSVLELSGKTDLSGVSYDRGDNKAGQLVGTNESALIYAKGSGNDNDTNNGWKYIRSSLGTPSNGKTYNDLLCYGQVIRLKADDNSINGLGSDLITINEDHTVTLKAINSIDLTNNKEITITSADEFAVLSIAWNSRGNFGVESGITTANWSDIKSSTITISADIDLTGTGITGLSRDTYLDNKDDDTFTGILTGGENNKHTIKLVIGETFGYQESTLAIANTSGCGIVYATNSYHAAQGLFASIKGATIQNITIDGSINVSNEYSAITSGGIAAYTQGGSDADKAVKINNVTARESINAIGSNSQQLAVGGFFGAEKGGWLILEKNATAEPNITLSQVTDKGPWVSAGGVLGKVETSGFKLQVKSAIVGNSETEELKYSCITTDASNYAYIGGLIGLISTEANEHWIEIYDLTIDGIKIVADSAIDVSGGLLGSVWQNVGVYFMGTDSETKSMLTVKNSSVSASNANGVGGLAYRSSGIWEVRDYGIDIQSLSINSKGDVGLLVCRGEKGKIKIGSTDLTTDIGALYVKMTAYWRTAYKLVPKTISIKQTSGVFDEFVAHTAPTAGEITDINKNGIISIATRDDGNGSRVGVTEDGNNCTTYQNRTSYGQNHKTNGCSRYYYDLDQWLKEAATDVAHNKNNYIDTPQELMLWSVYLYANQNIKNYIITQKQEKTDQNLYDVQDSYTLNDGQWRIRAVNENTKINLDLKKYSYYPVRVEAYSVYFSYADITFYNEQIETAEKNTNKSTAGTRDQHTQHFTMHCGMLFNYISPNGQLTVKNVTFIGSIGKIHNNGSYGSGALIANMASGNISGTTPRIVTVTIQNSYLDGIKVTNCDGYAPLLINKVGNYTTVNVNGLSTRENSYTLGTIVASSLIGNVGDQTAKQINLSFEKIVLPDKKADGNTGIFSHATLLESFRHDGTSSGATYNFIKSEDWNGTNHVHDVTYGKEINASIEYPGMQVWYYDEAGYGSNDNLVKDANGNTDFSSYLPYVCKDNQYTQGGYCHEIKVNQRMANIVTGCGTYGHPYVIKNEREMSVLAEYMAGGQAPQGWCVTITGNQSQNHVSETDVSTDVTYKYSSGKWKKVTKTDGSSENWKVDESAAPMENAQMRTYLLNAYYDLQGAETNNSYTLQMTNFSGFGTATNPFKGVLTSTKNTTIILEGSAPANGLVGYSLGCVVKDLVISYENCTEKSMSYREPTNASKYYYSIVVFGGVIGCALGGDNIIDNVSVSYGNKWLTLSDNKSYLIPIGGYVGEIAGGGVILRNIKTVNAGLINANIKSGASGVSSSDGYSNMYVNPYVGRVLDGFAFYEVTKTSTATDSFWTELDNTDKNYKINTLSAEDVGCVTVVSDTDGTSTVTANNAKGLLVLSAIVNSGAASGGESNAYRNSANTSNKTVNNVSYRFAGTYGKVRNAAYSSIGKAGTDASTDFALSIKDDQQIPFATSGSENLPYLVTKYCSASGVVFNFCNTSGVNIALTAKGSYDMTVFGSGYQGIGARYVSYAIVQDSNDLKKPTAIVPQIASFNGNGSTITVNTVVREYSNDDFRTAAVGGVFNELGVGTSNSTVQNLTIQGTAQRNNKNTAEVSVKYYDGQGKKATKTSYIADVGGFAGAVSRVWLNKDGSASANFDSVTIQKLDITGPRNAGGLVGSSITKSGTNSGIVIEEIPLYNYSETNTSLTALKNNVNINLCNTSYEKLTVTAYNGAGGFVGYIKADTPSSLEVTKDNFIVGNDSIIKSIYNVDDATDTYTGAGGVFGYIESNVTINVSESKTKYQEAVIQDVTINADKYAGGFIGKIAEKKNYKINLASYKVIENATSGVKISTTVKGQGIGVSSNNRKEGAGGVIGYAQGNGDNTIKNCSVTNAAINDSSKITNLNQDHEGAGGIVGLITDGSSVSIENCTVTYSNIYGAVAGGIAGITKVTTTFKNCTVIGQSETEKSNIKARCTASGILGYWFSNGTGTLENCRVRYADISGQHWGVGALIGDGDGVGGSLYIYDTSIMDSSVTAAGGNWYHGGGIIGDLRGDLTANNLLFSNTEINVSTNDSHCAGLLVGKLDKNNNGTSNIYIAGVSIQSIPDKSKNFGLIGNESKRSYNGYIAFADYSGASVNAMNTADSSSSSDSKSLLEATDKKPYVVTSPKSALGVADTADDSEAFLYGDGASWTTTGNSMITIAQTILESRNNGNGNHYAYNSTGVTDTDFDFKSAISTYNVNQTTQIKDDFPVLQISGGDSDTVTNYLNILTNGGFSAANRLNSSTATHVTATATVYSYQDGKFIKAVDDNNKPITPALTVESNAQNKITFSTTTDYDNTRDRFTLLKVTFEENQHKYNVLIPIIVRRMLEIDFSATLTYGTDFNSSNYSGLDAHVLESYGSSITGYLTYVYNSKNGEYTDYGWDSYINAGGNVMNSMNKKIRFVTTSMTKLPKGMQLTLVDPVTGRAYYYTATGEETSDNLNLDISLSEFVDSDGKSYQEQSISELMKATVDTKGGNFIEVDETGKPVGATVTDEKDYPSPTVKIKGEKGYQYYRLADEFLKEKGTCSIHVKESTLQKDGKSSIVENYYLVITIPTTAKDTVPAFNGSLQTEIGNSIPHQLHYRKIGNNDPDDHGGTASTYQISTGYQQRLSETGNGLSKEITVADSSLKVDVTDEITFPIGQAYNDSDQLYLRIAGNLQKTIDGSVSSEQFPSGTTGLAHFYVYTKDSSGNKTYYSFVDGKWTSNNSEQVAAEYTWTSTGDNMELVLSTDGKIENAISLAGVRGKIKEADPAASTGTFYVEVQMDASLPASGLEVVPESKKGTNNLPTDYVKLAYSSQISTVKQSLTYSSNRASLSQTETAYYREEPAGAKLTYEADTIDQLGINLLDPQYLDVSKEHALIDTTAVYSLASMKNLDDALKDSTGIRFTLTLAPKNTNSGSMEDYAGVITNASDYLGVELKSKDSGNVAYDSNTGTWSWIVPQSTYWSDGNIKTDSVFDGSVLTQAIQLKVNVANVESSNHYYSNYKVVLTAEIMKNDKDVIDGTHQDDNIIYTLARISMDFVDRQ